jgi:hypothetical protein
MWYFSMMPRRRFATLAGTLLLAAAGLFPPTGPAYASSTLSVAPATVAPGDTFTITFTAARDFASSQQGMGFYADNGPLGTLDSFATVVSCNGPIAGPCQTLAGIGYIVPTGPFPVGSTVSGSLTLRVNAGTPAGSFGVRYQFGGEQTRTGPTVTVTAPLWPFTGFFHPAHWVIAGLPVPLRFSLGGDHGLNIFTAGYPVSRRVECGDGTPVDGVDQAAHGRLIRDTASGRYTYLWKTGRAWRHSCRTFDLQLTDGSHHLARFSFN